MHSPSMSIRSLHARLYQYTCRQRTKICGPDSVRPSISVSLFGATRQFRSSPGSSTWQQDRARKLNSSRRPAQRFTEPPEYGHRCHKCRALHSTRRVASATKPSATGNAKREKETMVWSSSPQSLKGTQVIRQQMLKKISVLNQHENIYTIPNILTFSRLIAAPAIGYLVLYDNHVWAAALFAYAGVSDLVDGWIARKYKLQTVIGSVIDPMADKALMTILVGCLAVKGALPLWLATLIFGRDMSLGIAAIYYRYASLPAPKTFMRYWDFSLPSAEVHPTQISKWNTFLQLGLIGCTLIEPLVATSGLLTHLDTQSGLHGLQYLVAGTTLWSGASYLWTRDAVKMLGKDEALKQKQGVRGRAILGVSFAAFTALAVHFAMQEVTPGESENTQ